MLEINELPNWTSLLTDAQVETLFSTYEASEPSDTEALLIALSDILDDLENMGVDIDAALAAYEDETAESDE